MRFIRLTRMHCGTCRIERKLAIIRKRTFFKLYINLFLFENAFNLDMFCKKTLFSFKCDLSICRFRLIITQHLFIHLDRFRSWHFCQARALMKTIIGRLFEGTWHCIKSNFLSGLTLKKRKPLTNSYILSADYSKHCLLSSISIRLPFFWSGFMKKMWSLKEIGKRYRGKSRHICQRNIGLQNEFSTKLLRPPLWSLFRKVRDRSRYVFANPFEKCRKNIRLSGGFLNSF